MTDALSAEDDPAAWVGEAMSLLESATAASADVLGRAVGLLRRAVAATPTDNSAYAGRLSRLGSALAMRFERLGDLSDLDEAVAIGRAAVAAASADHHERGAVLAALSGALLTRSLRMNDVTNLDEAIELGRAAANATAPDDPGRAARLSGLALALRAKFDQGGSLAALDEAIEVGRAAVAAAEPDHPGRAGYLSSLGLALRIRFDRRNTWADIDEAITLSRAAVAAVPLDHPHRAGYLSNLGAALLELDPDPAALDEAVEAFRSAVAGIAPDHPARAGFLSNLAVALRTRFDRTGNSGDLDEAIEVGRAAVAATSPDDPERAARQSNLVLALRTRFDQTENTADLDEAIEAGRAAVAATPLGHRARPIRLSNLGSALAGRFDRTGEPADIDEAVDLLRAAVNEIEADHPSRPGYLANLAIVLRTRFRWSDEVMDLDEAIDAGRAAVAATPPNHPEWPRRQSNLGLALRARYERLGNSTDLNDAIEAGRSAVRAYGPDHPERAAVLSNFGLALAARAEQGAAATDVDELSAVLGEAMRLPTASPATRTRCAIRLGWALAGRDWLGAMSAWETALGLLPQILHRSLSRDDRQRLLRMLTGVGPMAAATALAIADADGGADQAWEVLEQGRAVLLGQALDTIPDPELRRAEPELAERVARVRRDLNAEVSPSRPGMTATDAAKLRRQAAEEWDRLVSTILGRPGFHRYGRPPSLSELRQAVGSGVIVAVTVTDWRCDALILTPRGAEHLPLRALDRHEAIDRANSFIMATTEPGLRANRVMRETLAWLWDTVARPVLDHLDRGGHLSSSDSAVPRVWWLPTEALTVLPLHAAGRHDTPGLSVLDRVVSSYTPTVRMLTRARRTATSARSRSHGLAVSIDDAPGQAPLSGTTDEGRMAQAAHQRLGVSSRWLRDEQATVASVRTELDNSGCVHLACHGVAEPDPADSHLVLWDGKLSVRALADLDLTGAHLAYLSACTTAFGGTRLLDEAIHIASALQVAGFPHVVATLWPITDRQAPRLAKAFYERLADGEEPAQATHNAVRSLRDEYRDAPYLWAPYVHFGP